MKDYEEIITHTIKELGITANKKAIITYAMR